MQSLDLLSVHSFASSSNLDASSSPNPMFGQGIQQAAQCVPYQAREKPVQKTLQEPPPPDRQQDTKMSEQGEELSSIK